MASETEYQRAWRERGEVEAALRKWNRNQSSPTFMKIVGTIGGLAGAGLLCTFVSDPSWAAAPALFFVAMFGSLPFMIPSLLRGEVEARKEASETLRRLTNWKLPQ